MARTISTCGMYSLLVLTVQSCQKARPTCSCAYWWFTAVVVVALAAAAVYAPARKDFCYHAIQKAGGVDNPVEHPYNILCSGKAKTILVLLYHSSRRPQVCCDYYRNDHRNNRIDDLCKETALPPCVGSLPYY